MNMVHRLPLPLCLSFSSCHSHVCGCPLLLNSLSLLSVLLCVSAGISQSQIQSRLTFVFNSWISSQKSQDLNEDGISHLGCERIRQDSQVGIWGAQNSRLCVADQSGFHRLSRFSQCEGFFRLFASMLLTPDTQPYKNTSGGEMSHGKFSIQLFVNTRLERVMLRPLSCDGFYWQKKVKRCKNT